jgi:hypothetical protein
MRLFLFCVFVGLALAIWVAAAAYLAGAFR